MLPAVSCECTSGLIFIGWVVRPPPLEEFFYVCCAVPNDAWTHVRGFKGTSLFVPLDRALRNQERRAEVFAGVVMWVRFHFGKIQTSNARCWKDYF